MANNTTTGNHLIEEQVKQLLVEPLEAASVVLNAGPKVIPSSEPLRITTLEEGFESAVVGEGELIPDGGEASFGQILLMPTERKSIKSIVRFSNEQLRQSAVDVSALFQKRLVQDVANKLDNELLAGTGLDEDDVANHGILGLINQPGLETAPMVLTDTDWALDALAEMAAKEITPTRFILNGSDFFKLRKIKDSDGRYIVNGGPAEGAPYTLFEIPVTITNKLAEGTGMLAKMDDIVVVRDIDPQVTILTERYAEYDQTGIRVTTRYDLGLLRKDSVLLLEVA